MSTPGCVNTPNHWTRKEDSLLHRHIMEQHKNNTDTPQLSMKVVSRHPTALDRQAAESMRIANSSRDRIMNKTGIRSQQDLAGPTFGGPTPAARQVICLRRLLRATGLASMKLSSIVETCCRPCQLEINMCRSSNAYVNDIKQLSRRGHFEHYVGKYGLCFYISQSVRWRSAMCLFSKNNHDNIF